MIRVLVVDDHAVVRSGLAFVINSQEDMTVVGDAADGLEAYLETERHTPDVVLMDLSMPPGENGLVTTKRIKDNFPDTKVLILTMHDDEEYLFRALKLGASGYILKNAKDDELLEAIRTLQEGEMYIYPKVTTALVRQFLQQNNGEKINTSYVQLSNREQEVLPLIALGYGNKEIANKLCISVKTVETHKSNIMNKLDLSTRAEIVKYAIKKNLIDL
ncbi:two-component response regulator NreC [Listeria weihenstephanensis FSL R9-0317]|uniref:LuxR family transcriptional regulator n=1 Tax=Listeria weihenstephanensis TaxID=1006155 RepID=A0A1S7FQV2_9LIST|nr:response regulator transcription factor [Listeria weihenstephanensis]AQY49831.1 LuxR family transcriptional regulator [Listeria weihenstephanensis]EUJ40311.1 two-component response regulator NreC [Listeria weihenstephanensis FSL R9-0317]